LSSRGTEAADRAHTIVRADNGETLLLEEIIDQIKEVFINKIKV